MKKALPIQKQDFVGASFFVVVVVAAAVVGYAVESKLLSRDL